MSKYKETIKALKENIDLSSNIVYAIRVEAKDNDGTIVDSEFIKNLIRKHFGEFGFVSIGGYSTPEDGNVVFVVFSNALSLKQLQMFEIDLIQQSYVCGLRYVNIAEYIRSLEKADKRENEK